MSTTPPPSASGVSGLVDRLRTYLIGVGIGAMLLGGFWFMKRQAALQQGQPTTPNGVQVDTTPKPSAN